MFELIIIGLFLLIASYSDLKTREVPDILSYSFIILGLVFSAVKSIIFLEWTYFVFSLVGFSAVFLLSLLLFYSGQWGGGDAKLLMGIGAWYGLTWFEFPLLVTFVVNLLVFGAIYGMFYAMVLMIKHRKKISAYFKEKGNHLRKIRWGIRIVVVLAIITAFLIPDGMLRVFIVVFTCLGFIGFYAIMFVKALEKTVLIRKLSTSKLTEGDWVLDEIKDKFMPRKTGITKKDIAVLRKIRKMVTVREGIPFIPSFLLAFIFTELLGNWFLMLV